MFWQKEPNGVPHFMLIQKLVCSHIKRKSNIFRLYWSMWYISAIIQNLLKSTLQDIGLGDKQKIASLLQLSKLWIGNSYALSRYNVIQKSIEDDIYCLVYDSWYIILASCVICDWTTTYCVKHLSGMGGRNAETRPRLDDGCCWEADDHRADVSL